MPIPSHISFDFEAWNQRRKTFKVIAWVLLGICLLAIIDIPFPPLQPRISIYILILLSIPTLICSYIAFGSPSTRMIMQISENNHQGYLTHALILHYLDVSPKSIEKMLQQYWNAGYVKVVSKVEQQTPISQMVFKWIGVVGRRPAGTPAQTTADLAANPEMDADAITRALLEGTLDLTGGLPGGRN
jgi:hypothetical protein